MHNMINLYSVTNNIQSSSVISSVSNAVIVIFPSVIVIISVSISVSSIIIVMGTIVVLFVPFSRI